MSRFPIWLTPLLSCCLLAPQVTADQPAARLPDGVVRQLGSPRFQNLGRVFALGFAPDGKSLAAGAWDGSVHIWDVATGTERGPRAGHAGWVKAVAFAPDGKLVATAGKDRAICLWDAATGKLVRRLEGHRHAVTGLAWSPTGNLLASKGMDMTVRIWDPATGKELRHRDVNRNYDGPVAFAPDGKTIAFGDADTAIVLWDAATGTELRQIKAFAGAQAIVFSPDGRALAAAGWERGIRLWEVATGKELPALGRESGDFTRLAFAADGKSLAAAHGDGTLDVWELVSRRQRCHFVGIANGDICAALSPDGRLLASGSVDVTVLLWDLSGLAPDGKLRVVDLTPADVRALWADLADADAARAYRALWKMTAGAAQSVPWLQTHLHPAVAVDAGRITQLLRDLDSEDFARRKQAAEELEKLGDGAEPALRKALADRPSLEVRRRLERLLDKAEDDPTPDRLRTFRSLEVLEHVHSAEARQLLETLAGGAPGARLTREAQAALKRLKGQAARSEK